MTAKVAIVTGANKGIGFAIVRGLCKRFEGDVYLTSRDIERGKNAVEELKKEGLNPKYHQLDITDKHSLEDFRDYIKKNYDGIDVLVNNAAIAFKNSATEPVSVQAEQTLFVNYFCLVSACDILFPLLKTGARVVNISSSCGHLSNIPSKDLQSKFMDQTLTVPALSSLLQSYIDSAKQASLAEWGNSSYAVSKVGGPLSIDQGAEAPLFLALDAPDTVKGQYVWYNKDIVSWVDNKL
ncbi:putative dehydrogenase with different specificities related to short-chain alcohol dehydrogenase [Operophtera brumata]|uniref:Putative dehydrogenase with different specificities related to short-chain alcohol dehydrogenase n=1 Tax=Operophtera brumata TaxID=104452 RepID=A0A0L7KMV3_OPEBR|nr:putative dehydrogenase with different specificities related to short-chain alcohol dehydrogenase [Operophtera brumata]